MKNLKMGTTNSAKISQLDDCLTPVGIHVVGVTDKSLLPFVEEDGKTVEENAQKKAIAYAKEFGERVISMDNELHIDGLTDEQQPGLHVRRINGVEANSDDELLDHYQKVIASLGDRVTGYWRFGICIADPNGKKWSTVIKSPRIFTSQRSSKMILDYPLESIQIQPETGKYISEMSEQEKAAFWQKAIGEELITFVQSIDW